MGQIIAVVSGKGGTGKTSFTALTGMALAAMGSRTLCLDCDIGLRNLDIAMGLTDRALMDFTDVIAGRASLEEAAVPHPQSPNLFLLTAPVSLRGGEVGAQEMAALLAAVREQFDFCLIDASAGLGSAFRLAVGSADHAIVVATPDPTSLRDAQRTVMELRDFPQNRLHLVVNRVRKKLLRSLHSNIDDAIDAAGLPLLGVIPEEEDVPALLGRGMTGRGGGRATYSGAAETMQAFFGRSGAQAAAQACWNIARRLRGERTPLMKL